MAQTQPAPIDAFRMKTADSAAFYELIDAPVLAVRLKVPESWVRNHTWAGTEDPIPHVKLGRYVRYRWGHPELAQWLGGESVRAGRGSHDTQDDKTTAQVRQTRSCSC